MNPTRQQSEFFAQLAGPFTGEALFDQLSDLVFFIKNRRCEYVVVNQTLVERCGCRDKAELIGRRADQLFPGQLGAGYLAQDESVLRSGNAILDQLEVHSYADGTRGWCLTNKLPLHDRQGRVIGLMGSSKDLQAPKERSRDFSAIAASVEYIRKNYSESLRVAVLARRAGLSDYQFERRFRLLFHLTAGQFILQTRMEAAMQRLRETNDNIATIALDCGYSDQSAFTRQFRQLSGMTPSDFRQRSTLPPLNPPPHREH
ncbi:MAG TPA: AraC family transcriptional regulator [Verrucomicrobiae bacterium]